MFGRQDEYGTFNLRRMKQGHSCSLKRQDRLVFDVISVNTLLGKQYARALPAKVHNAKQ
jgi:hypothetical protein